MTTTIKVKTNEENPEPVEIIADAIIRVAEGFEKMKASPLTERAIILLLHDAIGSAHITKKQIGYVLNYAPLLKEHYIKKAKK